MKAPEVGICPHIMSRNRRKTIDLSERNIILKRIHDASLLVFVNNASLAFYFSAEDAGAFLVLCNNTT
jgi:hypothetical protein